MPKKIGSTKVKLELKAVDMCKLAFDPRITALQKSAEGKGLSFSWLVGYVPNIIVDPDKITQAFVNLVDNAVKFTEHGSIEVRVSRSGARRLVCSVKDTGIGISEDAKRFLFKKAEEQSEEGAKHGLSVVREIVRLHHGRIGFESQLGKGSMFWFDLPLPPNSSDLMFGYRL